MKKILLFIAIFAVSLNMQAQEKMFVWQNGVKTDFVVADVDSVTFTKDEEITPPTTGTENGYEWVDLGLSVKWATCNVGATKPEEYGDYFAWGETQPKSTYDWSTYKWCNGSPTSLTKYCTKSSFGTVDNKTILEAADDATRANWGGSWRMPTDAELTELREQCTWTWTTQNGVYGYKVTSKKSGYTNKSIFLPAAGFRYGSSLYYAGSDGAYWSSSLDTGRSLYAWYVYFINSDGVDWNYSDRFCGFSVRPVCTQNSMSQREMYIWQNGGKTTFVVADVDSVTFTKDEKVTPPTTGTENGYEWVDLGLSVKWATCNVGASKPEEYGDYFAWGETQPKSTYNWSTYKYCNGSSSTLTKYNTVSSRGTVDNKTQLELSDDAARANWGGTWRMPTIEEQQELIVNCTWTWTTQNGVYGYKVTSKKSGYTNKSIFLPAAGRRFDSSLDDAGSSGKYWSSSLNTDDRPYIAYYLHFDSSIVGWSYVSRGSGQSVRPVCP